MTCHTEESSMGSGPRWRRLAPAVLASLVAAASQSARAETKDLSNLSLADLGNIEITSVSRHAERLSEAPTSIFVITADDIRRSGATTLPEALRLAPNLQVAQASASEYAISARGFNGSSANKLLVLIDGRSVYSPLFSGVFWDVQDVALADIERIEVISGPGGTLWGVNAVNGVINVITRSAEQTAGELVSAGAGNREEQLVLRHGAPLAGGDFRIFATHTGLRHTETSTDAPIDDASRFTHIGMRADWEHRATRFTLQGDAYDGRRGQPLPGTISIFGVTLDLGNIKTSGADLLARWESELEDGAGWVVQAYVDRTQRTVPPTFAETLDIVDLQLQHTFHPAAAHTIVWGAEIRHGMDDVTNSAYVAFLPARLDQTWASLFGQDEIALRRDLKMTLGTRLERNDYTGAEWLPNARLAWKLSPEHLLWGAVSRTVRAPSRLDHDTYVPGAPPFLLRGGPDVRSEIAIVEEIGYRGQPTPDSTFSVTAFHADYSLLRTQQINLSPLYVFYTNGMRGNVQGVEMWGSWQATPHWRLHGGFTRLVQEFAIGSGSEDTTAPAQSAGGTPGQQALLRSSLDLPHDTEFDCALRYVSELSLPEVPSYVAVDLRLAWRPRPGLELSLTGRNLGERHAEFTSPDTRSMFGPGVFMALASRF
jgi:iron complex outermembrane receptor protein